MSKHIHIHRTRDEEFKRFDTTVTELRRIENRLYTRLDSEKDNEKAKRINRAANTISIEVMTIGKLIEHYHRNLDSYQTLVQQGDTKLASELVSTLRRSEALIARKANELKKLETTDMAIKGKKEDEQGITYNGKWYSRITMVQSMGAGKYKIKATHGEYTLEGGRALGGARNDWFLEGSRINKHIVVSGLVDALNLLQNM